MLLGWVTKCLSENEDRSVEDETVIRDSDVFLSMIYVSASLILNLEILQIQNTSVGSC